MIIFLQNLLRFIILMIIQIFILNNVRFLGYVNPYVYILFIFLLPVRFPRWITLFMAFGTGLLIDMFSNSPGLHAFSTVLIAYLRAPVINMFTSVEEGANPTPSFHSFGVVPFISFVSLLVIIHHATLFMLEVFSFVNFGDTFIRIVINSLITILIMLAVQSFVKK